MYADATGAGVDVVGDAALEDSAAAACSSKDCG